MPKETWHDIQAKGTPEQHARYWKQIETERYLRDVGALRPTFSERRQTTSRRGFWRWLFGR